MALQKNCASILHFVQSARDVAGLKLNAAAAVDDDVRVQPEVARIERAVFHAVIQSESHEVNVLDSALLQVMGESGVTAMSVVEERAVTIDLRVDPFVENMRDSARVE